MLLNATQPTPTSNHSDRPSSPSSGIGSEKRIRCRGTSGVTFRRLISFFALEECGGIMGLRDFCRPVAMYYECRGI